MLCRLCLLNGECNIHIIYMVYKRDSVSRHVFDRNISQIGDPTTSLQNMFFSELTLPKTNSLPPKNGPKHKKETGLPTIIFQETCSFSWISRSRFFTRLPKKSHFTDFEKPSISKDALTLTLVVLCVLCVCEKLPGLFPRHFCVGIINFCCKVRWTVSWLTVVVFVLTQVAFFLFRETSGSSCWMTHSNCPSMTFIARRL